MYFHGANAGTKKELIEKDGRIAFEMDVHEEARISSVACNSYMDYESVCGTGNAEIADDTQKRAYLEKIMRHYTDIPFEMLEKAIEGGIIVEKHNIIVAKFSDICYTFLMKIISRTVAWLGSGDLHEV